MVSRMKIAVAQIKQETNTFNPVKTTIDTFRRYGFFKGPEIISNIKTNEVGGFIDTLRDAKHKIEPILATYAQSGGTIIYNAIKEIERHLTTPLKKSLPLDGVLLSLHGAMIAERVIDADG